MPASDAASRPLALSSTIDQRALDARQRLVLLGFSFSRRWASSGRSGTRAIIQRSVGGMAMVVTIAMATIIV